MKPPEQREHIRYEVQWEVEVSTENWDDVLTLTTTSVSRGGLFLRSANPAAPGTSVNVSLTLPDGNTVKLVGDVVRTVLPDESDAPGFAICFDPSRSSDLVLLESMANAFGSPERGDATARSIKAAVITRQVSTEASAIELSLDGGPAAQDRPKRKSSPSLSGVPAVEFMDTDAPAAFADQATVQRKPPKDALEASVEESRRRASTPPPIKPAAKKKLAEKKAAAEAKPEPEPEKPAEGTNEKGPRATIDVLVTVDAAFDELERGLTDSPATDAASADGKAEDGAVSYDVGEQIRIAMSGEIHEAPVAGGEEDGGAGTTLPPLVAEGDVPESRPTVEAPVARTKQVTREVAPAGGRPTTDAPAAKDEAPESEESAPSPEPSRHTLPSIARRSGGDEALAFGIDFGTSYSSIGLFYEGEVSVLEDAEGYPLVPTAVSYPEQGAPLVGWAAREQLALQPSTTFSSPKRLIGRQFGDPSIESLLASSPVRYESGPGGQLVADVFGNPVTVTQVAAEVFRHLAAMGEGRAERPVRKIALAAPVAFEDAQRNAITRAAKMGGLEVVAIIDEPVAAAIAFGASGDEEQLIAIYDFGGGTFDFTLLRAGGGNFEVLGEAGDAWLGGDDFDLALANYVADQFWNQKKVDLRTRQVEWQRLLFLCERAKRQLSKVEETVVESKGIALSLKGALDLKVGLNRGLFADLCRDLVERSIEAMETCFMLTGHEPAEVKQIVMTGGVSRIPMVRERVQAFFDREIRSTVNPEEAVVIGTARFARGAGGIYREGG